MSNIKPKFRSVASLKIILVMIFFMASIPSLFSATKVGFIYIGPVGDHGWTYQHNEGVKYLQKELGNQVDVTYVESVPEGPDAERVLQQLASKGNQIIFATSFGYMNPVIKVAKRYPKIKFEHATGYMRQKNVATYSARFYEGRHVIGLIAGKMSKTGTVGYIASFPIPEVVRGINAAYLAAKSVNPKIKFKVIWVSTWFDPGKEADAAKALIDQGADILMQHTDSPAAMTIAEEKGIYAFGQASDMSKFGPNAQLTSIIDNWGPYYVERVKAVMSGQWKSKDTFYGMKEGMAEMAPFNKKMPKAVKDLANKAIEEIKSGKRHPFTGPINKQDGSVWLKAGQTASDEELIGMNFYVEGVTGTLPK